MFCGFTYYLSKKNSYCMEQSADMVSEYMIEFNGDDTFYPNCVTFWLTLMLPNDPLHPISNFSEGKLCGKYLELQFSYGV